MNLGPLSLVEGLTPRRPSVLIWEQKRLNGGTFPFCGKVFANRFGKDGRRFHTSAQPKPMIPRLRLCVLVFALLSVLCGSSGVTQTSSTGQTGGGSTHTPTAKPRKAQPNCTDNGTYTNSHGQTVRRPENCFATPQGATAQCRDGSYSFSRSRRGTCSHHGGVAKWL